MIHRYGETVLIEEKLSSSECTRGWRKFWHSPGHASPDCQYSEERTTGNGWFSQ